MHDDEERFIAYQNGLQEAIMTAIVRHAEEFGGFPGHAVIDNSAVWNCTLLIGAMFIGASSALETPRQQRLFCEVQAKRLRKLIAEARANPELRSGVFGLRPAGRSDVH
jgi:hypothetical protein